MGFNLFHSPYAFRFGRLGKYIYIHILHIGLAVRIGLLPQADRIIFIDHR